VPEGPEIRQSADELQSVLLNQPITNLVFGLAHLKHFEAQIVGACCMKVAPRGKAMLISFDNGLYLFSHNQLYGKWVVLKKGQVHHTTRQLRIAITTPMGEARLYSASDIEVLTKSGLSTHPFLSKLGPDILDEALSDEAFIERFHLPQFLKRTLASLLLDQAFIAGTGNYLRSEILFDQKLNPKCRLGELSQKQRTALAMAVREITQRSYETHGICVSKPDQKQLRAEKNDYEYYRFSVFGHDGRACLRCSTPIEKTNIASRRLYFCPNCQGEPCR
jgi:endonuclease-8